MDSKYIWFSCLWQKNIEYRDTIVRIWIIFKILVFSTQIWRREIPQKGPRENYQSITRMVIVLFYRENEKRRSFFQELHWSQIKTEYIRLNISIANRTKYIRSDTLECSWRVYKCKKNWFNYINTNQPVHMVAMDYVFSPF